MGVSYDYTGSEHVERHPLWRKIHPFQWLVGVGYLSSNSDVSMNTIKQLLIVLVFAVPALAQVPQVASLRVVPDSVVMAAGQKQQLDVTVVLTDSSLHPGETYVTWTSSHPEIADVVGTTVYGRAVGTATVTATTSGGIAHSTMVTVTQAQ